jgi:hypothetical protein
MREERENRACIGEERAINKIELIISNILENLSGLIIPNKGSTRKGKKRNIDISGLLTRFRLSQHLAQASSPLLALSLKTRFIGPYGARTLLQTVPCSHEIHDVRFAKRPSWN